MTKVKYNNGKLQIILFLASVFVRTAFSQPLPTDISLHYDVLADSSILIAGERHIAARHDERFDYYVQVNNDGPETATGIVLEISQSPQIPFGDFNRQPSTTSDSLLTWTIDSLRTGETLSWSFAARGNTNLSEFPFCVRSLATVAADNDTTLANNSGETIIYILGEPVVLPDLAAHQNVAADSFETAGADSLPLLAQGKVYPVDIRIANWSSVAATGVTVSYVVDDMLQIAGASPSPDIYRPDSVVWNLSSIGAARSIKLLVELLVPEVMPEGPNTMHNVLMVRAENEDPARFANNSSILNLVNYGIVAEPFAPLIEVAPAVATVSDSLRIRVQFPITITEWDLLVHIPAGEVITDFADDFITGTAIAPNTWYEVEAPFCYPLLQGSSGNDELIFEVRAKGRYGSSGSASAHVTVSPGFDLMPPNVVLPGSASIPIDFVMAGGRVEMKLYDVAGRFIANLAEGEYQAGRHTLVWDGKTASGQLVGSGLYLVTLQTEAANTWKKMIIVR